MASSITTVVPSGPVKSACIRNLYNLDLPPRFSSCANSTLGTVDSDFESICCDGNIIDTTQDLFQNLQSVSHRWDIANFVCCRTLVPEPGGLMPIIQGNGRTCTDQYAFPTPLLSLAATNTANAQIYPVTFLDASGEPPNLGNFTFTQTPKCLWVATVDGQATMEVTVPAATITTLPVGWPDSKSPLIYTIENPLTLTASSIPSETTSAETTTASRAGNASVTTPDITSMANTQLTAMAPTTTTSTTSAGTKVGGVRLATFGLLACLATIWSALP